MPRIGEDREGFVAERPVIVGRDRECDHRFAMNRDRDEDCLVVDDLCAPPERLFEVGMLVVFEPQFE